MKIRNGFVSNSSSSSFIVGFKTKPTDKAALQTLLFGREELLSPPYGLSEGEEAVRVEDAVTTIFADLSKAKKLTKKGVLEAIQGGYFPGYPDYNCYKNEPCRVTEREFREKFGHAVQECHDTKDKEKKKWYVKWSKELDEYHDERNKEVDAAAEVCLEQHWHLFKDCKYIYELHYGDHNGAFESQLEHGNTFARIPHLTISHH